MHGKTTLLHSIVTLVSFTCLLSATSTYPPYYAIDVDSENANGMELFQRYKTCQNLVYIHYYAVERHSNRKTILWLEDNVWRIDEDYRNNQNCMVSPGDEGKRLFKQNKTDEHLLPQPEHWYDVQSGTSDITLDSLPLHFCTIHKNNFFTGNNFDISSLPFANYEKNCKDEGDKVLYRDASSKNIKAMLLSTNAFNDSIIQCQYQDVLIHPDTNVALIKNCSDANAETLLYNHDCTEITEVSSNLCDSVTSSPEGSASGKGEKGPDVKLIAAISSSVAVIVVILTGILVWKKYNCFGRLNDKTGVDANEMYGQNEYYQYMEDRHQTNIVDENDYYDNDDED